MEAQVSPGMKNGGTISGRSLGSTEGYIQGRGTDLGP